MRKDTYLKRVRFCCFMKGLCRSLTWTYSMSIWGRCVFIVVVSSDTNSHISHDVEGRSPPESSGHGFSFCSNLDPGKTSAPDTYKTNKHTHTHTRTFNMSETDGLFVIMNMTSEFKSDVNVALSPRRSDKIKSVFIAVFHLYWFVSWSISAPDPHLKSAFIFNTKAHISHSTRLITCCTLFVCFYHISQLWQLGQSHSPYVATGNSLLFFTVVDSSTILFLMKAIWHLSITLRLPAWVTNYNSQNALLRTIQIPKTPNTSTRRTFTTYIVDFGNNSCRLRFYYLLCVFL